MRGRRGEFGFDERQCRQARGKGPRFFQTCPRVVGETRIRRDLGAQHQPFGAAAPHA